MWGVKNGLQGEIQLIQQWLTVNIKSRNPVVAQYEGSMSQLFFYICWNSEEVGSNVSKEMNMLSRLGQVSKSFLLLRPYIDLQWKVWPR